MQSSHQINTPNTSLDQALQAILNSKSEHPWDKTSFDREKISGGLKIIRKGANPGITDEDGNNIFHLIFSLNESSTVLLDELRMHSLFNSRQIYDKNKAGISPFQYAVQNTLSDCITMILTLTGRDQEIETEMFQSLLDYWAIEDTKKQQILIALIKAGVNSNTPNKDGDTILHLLIATNGRFSLLVEDLVKEYGADLATVNRFELTPLQHLLIKGEAIVNYAAELLELGESVNVDMESQMEKYKSMLTEYRKKDEDGNNIFHQLLLSVTEPVEKMNELLAHPFFKLGMVHAKNHAGFSPLQYAVQNRQTDCVESLLKKTFFNINININVCDVFSVFQPLLENKHEGDRQILISLIEDHVTFNLHNNIDHIMCLLLDGKNTDGQFNGLLEEIVTKLEQKKIARAHQAYLDKITMKNFHSLGALLLKCGDQYHQILSYLNTDCIIDEDGARFYWQQHHPAEADIQELTASPVQSQDKKQFPGISFFAGSNKLLTREEEMQPSMQQGRVFRLFMRHPFTPEITTQTQEPACQPGKGQHG